MRGTALVVVALICFVSTLSLLDSFTCGSLSCFGDLRDMPFPFRLKKKLDDDVSTASSRDSIPTLPPIARVNTDDFFSGSDSGHGEMSDAPRSTPAQSAAIESVASGQAPRRTKKRVKIPRSRKADEDQPGLIAELEAERTCALTDCERFSC